MQLKDVLVERHMVHEHARNDVQVRTCLFQWVDHIMRHIGAKASLSVYPPERKAKQSVYSGRTKEIYARTWTISVGAGHFKVQI